MMTCKQLVEILRDYLDGELPQEDCDLICEHMRICSPCHHYIDSYQVTIRMCKKLPMVALPQKLIDRLRAALKEAEQGGPQANA